jgi:hypothetical protein
VEAIGMVLGGLVGAGASFALGYRLGVRCRDLPESRYWIANGVGLIVGTLLAALGGWLSWSWMWVGGLGVMGGSLSGLKYGLGRDVSIRRVADRG